MNSNKCRLSGLKAQNAITKKYPAPPKLSKSCESWSHERAAKRHKGSKAKHSVSFVLLCGLTMAHGFVALWIQREPSGQVGNVTLHFGPHFFRLRRVDHFRNQTADLLHLFFFHPSCRDCRSPDAQS